MVGSTEANYGPLLSMTHISKAFPGVQALSDVCFSVNKGEIHSLIGQNGAGKSTLIKILAGVVPRDEGSIEFAGKALRRDIRPAEVRDSGISFIHQELELVPGFTVAQNIFLGREPVSRVRALSFRRMNEDARRYLAQVDTEGRIQPHDVVGELSVAQQQLVAIARALSQNPKLLVLDEPTSRLSRREVETLFQVLRGLRSTGIGIIYISHHLDEVFDIADRITVLRDGRVVSSMNTGSANTDMLVELMTGHKPSPVDNPAPICSAGTVPVLRVVNLTWVERLNDINFSLHKGEILAIFGPVGAGKTELGKILFGIMPPTTGTLLLDGAPIRRAAPGELVKKGMAFVPEDRRLFGLFSDAALYQNITIAHLSSVCNGGIFVRERLERRAAAGIAERLRIHPFILGMKVKQLSGGNQQKVVLAKWLVGNSRVIILDEPTVGVDVAAKDEIYNILHDLRASGVGVLILTSDAKEALRTADRILVLRKGELIAELEARTTNESELIRLSVEGVNAQCCAH